jgi:pimeloyl-ACP methyl ester carboxylesterase
VRHAEALHRLIPGSKLEIIAGGGHFLNWEMSGDYNARLADFLDRSAIWH